MLRQTELNSYSGDTLITTLHYIVFIQAHVHHYTHIEGMEVSDFSESLESLNGLIGDYTQLERQIHNPPQVEPRLQVMSWQWKSLKCELDYKLCYDIGNHWSMTDITSYVMALESF